MVDHPTYRLEDSTLLGPSVDQVADEDRCSSVGAPPHAVVLAWQVVKAPKELDQLGVVAVDVTDDVEATHGASLPERWQRRR